MDDGGEDLRGPAGLAPPQGTVAQHAEHGRAASVALGRPDGERQGAAGPGAGAADDRTAWRSCSAVSTRRTARPAVPYDAFTQCGYGTRAGRWSQRHHRGCGTPSSSHSAANSTLPATRSNDSAGATATGAPAGSRWRPAANSQACS